MKEVEYYTTKDGKCPYLEWFSTLSVEYQSKVIKRINRLESGLLGDCKKLTNSELSELRLFFGKGYRIYFKELDKVIILIVTAGDKSDQKRAIKQADKYLKDYLIRKEQNDNKT
ncbi:type II toxin-antitoxin system RelE/ParE family toxin [bacterium]|nr:type II toxin-antitoxin system RelE/ParE family toxin [bacterium]